MRSKATRLFTVIMAAAMLVSVLSACGLMGGNGSGGGLGDIVVVGDGGSSAPGSADGGDDDHRESGFADGEETQVSQKPMTDEPTQTPPNPQAGQSNSAIIGMWRSDSVTKCVQFFYENGTFSCVRWDNSSQLMCYKGSYTYNAGEGQITVTDLSRLYFTPTYYEFGELIDEVISTVISGSREEVLALLDLSHPIYSGKQAPGKEWTALSPSEIRFQELFVSANVEFKDENHMHLSKFLNNTADYERVSE